MLNRFTTVVVVAALAAISITNQAAEAIDGARLRVALERSGYAGSVESIDEPILMRYGPVDNATMRTSASLSMRTSSGVVERHFQTIDSVSISKDGDALGWEWRLLEMMTEDERQAPSNPILVARGKASYQGEVSGVSLSFPAAEASGDVTPQPGSIEYEAVVRLLKDGVIVFPTNPVKTGEVLYGLSASTTLAALFGVDLGEEDEVQARVVGKTKFSGRKCLLVIMEGQTSVQKDDDRADFDYSGYVVHDLETGLHIGAQVRISGTTINQGETVEIEGLITIDTNP